MRFNYLLYTLLTLWCCSSLSINSLNAQCDATVPNFVVDLSSNPDSAWISPDVFRAGNCCGTTAPDVCVSFTLTLAPDAQGIRFDVCDGAMPGGSLFYQIDCGPPTPVGGLICLTGTGPHTITFCKPGNNLNKYCITSISDPKAGADLSVNDGCIDTLSATGFSDTSITWNSIFPGGIGTYNNLLSCTQDCDTTVVTGVGGLPNYIDYQVCGYPIGGCGTTLICDTQRVTFYTTLNVDIQPENPTVCYGTTSATITANASGGKPPYLYRWSTGETTQSINVGVGTYTVELSDGSGCPPTYDTINVTSFANPIEALAGNDTVLCNQSSVASLEGSVIAASGGVWIGGNGSFSPDRNTLNASYTPTLAEINSGSLNLILETTGNGTCPPDQDTVMLVFSEYSATETITTNSVSCIGGSDGSATINVTGTHPPYSFQWDANAGGSTSSTATNLSAGTYTVTASDFLGCDSVYTITITEPDSLLSTISSSTNTSCFNGSDGTATVSASGGSPTYSYLWSNSQTGNSASGLSAGKHFVTITDANGCIKLDSVVITEPSQLSYTFTSTVDVSCFGGSDATASIGATGGTPPYSYLWSNNQTVQTATNLSAGTYSATLTDANGCTFSDSVTINEPPQLSSSVVVDQHALCAGTSTGSATATASGGTAPYSFAWSNSQNTATANGLAAGKYYVVITDANSCTTIDSVTITEPNFLSTSIASHKNVSCFGGSDGNANVSANGGTLPYTYQWSNNAQTGTITNLSQGTYYVTVTDANNCTIIDSVIITQPDSLYSQTTVTEVSCMGFNDGSAEINPIGGTPPYTYQWSNNQNSKKIENLSAGNYSVVVIDSLGCVTTNNVVILEPNEIELTVMSDDTICINESILLNASATGGSGVYTYNWSHSSLTGPSITVNPTSTSSYTVSVTDGNNCPGEIDSIQIVVRNIFEDSISVTVDDSICRGETASLKAFHQGENGPFNYSWNTPLNGFGPHNISPSTSTTYIFTATDLCQNSISDSAKIVVSEPPALNLSDTIAMGCSPLTVNFNNNTDGRYTYFWEFGNGSSSNEITPEFTYRSAGTYNVNLEIKSRQGCITKNSTPSKVIVWPSPNALFSATPEETTLESPEVEFYTTLYDAIDWTWNFGDSTTSKAGIPGIESSIKHMYGDTGSYTVRLTKTNEYGCTDVFERIIYVGPTYTLGVPNAFTPSPHGGNGGFYYKGELNNNIFYPFTEYVEEFQMMIFNRWGELIFESNDINIGWDGYYKGKLCQQDVYVYKIIIKHTDGETVTKVGNVTLLR